MPYIYRDELHEGEVAEDVFSRDDYMKIINERDEVITQRDVALDQINDLEIALRESKRKYADTFLTSSDRIKSDNSRDIQMESKVISFNDLFNMKGNNNAL